MTNEPSVPDAPPTPRWACKADRSGVGGNTPQDCDWPVCGCDPAAEKVLAALDERGLLVDRAADRGGHDGEH